MSRYNQMKTWAAGATVAVAAFGAGSAAQAQTAPPSGDMAQTLSSLSTQAQAKAEGAGNGALWACASDVLKQDGRFGAGAYIGHVNPRGDQGTQVGGGLSVRIGFDPSTVKDFGAITPSYSGFYKGTNNMGVATVDAGTSAVRHERMTTPYTISSGMNGETAGVKAAAADLADKVHQRCNSGALKPQ